MSSMDWSEKTTPLRQLMSPAEREVADLEHAFLDPQVRRSARLAQLLAEDYVEFGSSGHMFSRDQVIESMRTDPFAPRSVEEMNVKLLAPHVALVTYRVHYDEQPSAESLRSSVWVCRDGGWRLTFHQGTPCPTSK